MWEEVLWKALKTTIALLAAWLIFLLLAIWARLVER